MDKTDTKELLDFILFSIDVIQKRFTHISSTDDFLTDEIRTGNSRLHIDASSNDRRSFEKY
ncbi:hypothetical protein [Nitratifractor salsuginis]|uniref:hypothetical protein n=1 Tax=Nitratifractor salsuginis TaxID=269261 RepID=UPI0002DFA2CE|nr:hypothetical protein [Nitratifractor salsuginis]